MTKTERSAKNLEEVKELNLMRVLKLIHKMGCFSTENTILLQPDYITSGWYPLL